jgi:hypothetical protein
MEEKVHQTSLAGSSSGSSRDDIGWYMAVRNGFNAARIIPANADFSAQVRAIYSRANSDCGSEGRGFEPRRSPSLCRYTGPCPRAFPPWRYIAFRINNRTMHTATQMTRRRAQNSVLVRRWGMSVRSRTNALSEASTATTARMSATASTARYEPSITTAHYAGVGASALLLALLYERRGRRILRSWQRSPEGYSGAEMRESRSLPQAIVVEFLEQLAYLGLRVQAAEKLAKERVQNQNRQACLPCS